MEIDIRCYSENTHDFVGCGVYVSSEHPLPAEINIKSIEEGLEECFWEL